MKALIQSPIAIILISTMLASCASPNGTTGFGANDPCQPGGAQFTESATATFVKQAVLNPLAHIGGTLLATAAANYSQHYTGKLSTLLTKLVTPKRKPPKSPGQEFYDSGFNQNQQDFGTEFPQAIDPNTGLPLQTYPDTGVSYDPNTGLPFGDQQGYDPDQFSGDPTAGLGGIQPFNQGVPQDGFDPNFLGEVQPRGVPGQFPHATFPPTPCRQHTPLQNDPTASTQHAHYGYDPGVAQQGQPYPSGVNDPNNQGQAYDPYAQQHEQPSYGQPSSSHPYAQQGYPQDPHAQDSSQQDPYAQQTYQDDPYAQQGYPQAPYVQAGTEAEIQVSGNGTPTGLDVVVVKHARRNGIQVVLPMKDGDILKDGRGDTKAGDKFRIMFRPHSDGYVYVIAVDGSGWAQGIFPPPTSPLANPVKAGEQYVLPEGNNWFSLDQYKGIETLFFVASQEKRQDIEDILQSITGHERPASEHPQQVTKVAMVPYGVGRAGPGARSLAMPGELGQDLSVIPTSYLAEKAGQDLRLTRWFRHE